MYILIYFMYAPTFVKRRKSHSLSPCFFLLMVDTSLVSESTGSEIYQNAKTIVHNPGTNSGPVSNSANIIYI